MHILCLYCLVNEVFPLNASPILFLIYPPRRYVYCFEITEHTFSYIITTEICRVVQKYLKLTKNYRRMLESGQE